MEQVYIFLAEGFETVEALTPLDILRRLGVKVKTVKIKTPGELVDFQAVASSHGLVVRPDVFLSDVESEEPAEMIILPGGFPGYKNLTENEGVGRILAKYYQSGKYIATICGAASVLAANKIAEGSRITCHASVKELMGKYVYTGAEVERDGKIITARGAGLSLPFALEIAKVFASDAEIETLKRKLEL